MKMREQLKWWLFPGVNLHARLRNRVLPSRFGSPKNGETRMILDAELRDTGCEMRKQEGNKVRGVR